MSCEKQTTKHYTERPSPPYPANTCCGSVKKGNDGRMYQSVADKNGVCRWILKASANRSTSKTKSTSKPKKVTKKKSNSKPKKVTKSKSKPKKVTKPKKSSKSRSRSASPKRQKWISHEGKLGGHGYLTKTAAQRHKILDQCVKDWGYRSCLGSVLVLNRNRNIKSLYGDIIESDKNYVMRKHGNH